MLVSISMSEGRGYEIHVEMRTDFVETEGAIIQVYYPFNTNVFVIA
jgi:hypothetical protein